MTNEAPATQASKSPPPAATIHEAECSSGASGAIHYGTDIDLATAVNRRRAGLDVVVRGAEVKQNRRLAGMIEAAVGSCFRSEPHRRAGPLALPHFQQNEAPPDGHCFYETENRKARKKP